MTRPSADERLSQALRDLPSTSASAGFTRRVLRDLEAPARRTRRLQLRLAFTALAAALLVALGVQLTRESPSEAELLQARARSLRSESQRLRDEIHRLQRLAEETAPVLYLDETRQFDLVLDLRPYMEQTRPAGYAPAALTEERR